MVPYASRELKLREEDYTTKELEGSAVNWALEKWHVWLTRRPILVGTDHVALTYIRTCPLTNNRITRWIIKFQQLDITCEHIKGKDSNTLADAL